MFAVLMMAGTSLLGGWKEVDFDSEFVQTVLPYVHKNYLKILPEYKRRNTLCAFKSAQVQIVNGYNIKIVNALGFDEIGLELHVSPQKEITVRNFEHRISSNKEQIPLAGGWKTQKLDYAPELVQQCIAQYNSVKGINALPEKILLIRTQVVAGIKVHVVFIDQAGKTHSTIVIRNPSGKLAMEYGDSF